MSSLLNQAESHICTLNLSQIIRLNKLMPAGFKIEAYHTPRKSTRPQTPKEPVVIEPRKPRKRTRSRPISVLSVKNYLESGEKEMGLKLGGEAVKKCYELLQNLKKHPLAGPFLQPVDPVALNLSDYLEVIKDPMDLSTVERNLKVGVYANSQQFANDVRRIWLNAFTYNSVNSEMFFITLEMATYFEKNFRDFENLVFSPDGEERRLARDKEQLLDYMTRPMTLQEKRLLATNLKRMQAEQLKTAYKIITGRTCHVGTFQFNIDKLPPKTCRELEKFVKLTHQASLRANRQRNLTALKKHYAESDDRKKRQKTYYDEVEYY
mmetsp:Transcript_19996/g.37121  ORF Transcript_19996/g.37121 Transcript_19996/m.37121 type:complete len:322 (+) Transcript_19996:2102-3067(+)